ncbi:MAG: glycosyltransferase family 9 protein [Fibrobacterota bacterium]
MDKILVVRLSSLGDVLLTTLTVRALARRFPNAQIDFLTKKAYAPLLASNPRLQNVLTLNSGSLFEIFQLRRAVSGYDLIVDLHKNLRSLLITGAQLLPTVVRTRKWTLKRRLLTWLKLNLFKDTQSVAERYLETVRGFGVVDDGQGLEFLPSDDDTREATAIFERHGMGKGEAVALAPGAKWYTKRWPVEKYEALIRMMPDERFIVLGDAGDAEAGERLQAAAPERVVNLAGTTGLGVSGALLKRCRALLTHDTGLMHLACAAHVPVVAIFGSTVRTFGFFPFRARARVLEIDLPCRPCTTLGTHRCKLGTLECLQGIAVEAAANALRKVQTGPY